MGIWIFICPVCIIGILDGNSMIFYSRKHLSNWADALLMDSGAVTENLAKVCKEVQYGFSDARQIGI